MGCASSEATATTIEAIATGKRVLNLPLLRLIDLFDAHGLLDVAEQSKLTDDEIKECSLSERWATATKYAVMKEGRKTALKVCSTEDEAQKFIDDTEKDKDKLSIEERPGTDKKCMDYCPCASFCSYYKKTLRV